LAAYVKIDPSPSSESKAHIVYLVKIPPSKNAKMALDIEYQMLPQLIISMEDHNMHSYEVI